MSEPTAFPLRLPEMPLHDPFIVADSGSGLYHLYTSNLASSGAPGAGTMVYRSRDLREWAEPVPVFLVDEEDAPWAVHGAWAPEVHRWNDRWYLFTTLHDTDAPLPVPRPGEYGTPFPVANYRRSTIVAAADALTGPFRMLKPEAPILPADLMTLDGTLFVDEDGEPWMVCANEWLQRIDGTVEAFPLNRALDGVDGEPMVLFRGSDASWITRELPAGVPHQIAPYVTDGPQLHRFGDTLVCLWSTYEKNRLTEGGIDGDYVQTWAVAPSGRLEGPWEQREPLVRGDSGHGMLFTAFDGTLMMVLHRPFTGARGKLYEMTWDGSDLKVLRQRTDLDGD
ncbi:Glycosyl hydrolases family 43 [Glycomyces sambucus]|uniref:Glycosyl hydrolases family 43 n=1 Tax=Glycomyces sambucus TaxID=380244 RepID=A0A1G9HAV4_9ACTN|nr:family 43 glycosylhydrolase [Glycomyces sambucus]SDL10148.1 Glycosyl hydrolases family 43 [Glycomyces sambucus]